jgi:diguanylate cyclase (GGDEF)-like protein
MTHVWNRAGLLKILDAEIDRAVRMEVSVGAMFIDIDHLKATNDEHGHLVGDEVIKEVAVRLRAALRTYDSLGRFGGDEFVAVLPDCDADQAEAIGSRLRAQLGEHPVRTRALELPITASIGAVALAPREVIPAASLLDLADRALYRAKRAGRNRLVVESPPGL